MKKTAIGLTLISVLSACATKQVPRTKWTDPTLRVLLDPDSIDADNYVAIQSAIQSNGRWLLVDRSTGLRAVKKEQEMLHREEPDRFMDKEKFALWGKLYGVGAVIIAHQNCQRRRRFSQSEYLDCKNNLAVVNANTGVVICSATTQEEVDGWDGIATWAEAVDKLAEAFPKNFEPDKTDELLKRYQDVAQEEALRQKEIVAKEAADRKAEERATEEEFHSPEAIAKDLCAVEAMKKDIEEKIQHEKGITATSGVIDKQRMYFLGRSLVDTKEHGKKRRSEYKQKTGKEFDPSGCPSD